MFNEQEKKIGLVVGGIIVLLVGVYLVSLTRNSIKEHDYIGRSPEYQNNISVSGSAKVTAKPDIAVINIGVISDQTTVEVAQDDNTKKMNAIIKELKDKFSIAEADIRTSQYMVSPRYDWTDGRQNLVGYTASQTVTVKVRDFSKTGDILAMAGRLGSNNVNGPDFVVDDMDKYRDEARAQAIAEAKAKAKVLANDVGVKLGAIVGFNEGFGGEMPFMAVSAKDMSAEGMGGSVAPSPDIQPGSQEIEVQVSIVYELL